MDDPFSPRLGLAVGPPGAGKTTLLIQWAAQGEGHVAWYPSSRSDSKPGRMLSYFAGALATAVQGEPASTFSALVRCSEQLEHDFHFVVDDFHLLADTSAETELEQLMALKSPHLRFLIGSRRSPCINLARSELQTAFTVTGDDLRFRAAEIDRLFRNKYKQPLSPGGVSNLARQTDGWAAALHLFHLATTNLCPVEQRRAAESLSARSRFAQDYLTRHFLAGISSDMERLLRTTCLLDVLTPSRCNALLDRYDSRHLLEGLEQLGVISTEDDGMTYRSPKVLQQFLTADLADAEPVVRDHLRQRTAEILEQDGAVGSGLQVLAEGHDWDGVKHLLRQAGKSAVLPGTCGWAALIPEHVLPDDAWATLASSRRLLDDGCVASAYRIASRIPDLTTDHDCLDLARDLCLKSAVWAAVGAPIPFRGQPGELRDALHRNPGVIARSLANEPQPQDPLPTGLCLLLAGNQRSALPLLRRSAERLDVDAASALAAQLALAVFGSDSAGLASGVAASEVDAVQRQAERRGHTWLARLACGVQAALPGTPGCQDGVNAVIKSCEVRGDEWGAALIAASGALMRLRTGSPDPVAFEALAVRFRQLSAGTLEAWAHAAQALVSASFDMPGAAENAQSAEAFARTAAVPGALAVAYAAMALQKQHGYEDLMRMATLTGQSAGLITRPWTWLSRAGSRPEHHGREKHFVLNDPEQSPDPRSRADVTSGCTSPSLQITCFGGFSLCRNGIDLDLSKVRPQARTVLRILSLNAGRLVHRERLAGIMWADLDCASALHALQVSLSCLRGALQPEGTSGGQQLIVRQGEAYALIIGTGSNLDLADFDQALHAASVARSAGDNIIAAEALRRAVALYRGEVLPEDGPAEWVADTRERYRLRAAAAAASLAGMELGLGNAAAAAAAATRSVEIDPWRDESWRTLVDIFRQLGDPAAAQHAQQRYDLVLNSLGVPRDYGASAHDGLIVTTGPRTELPRRPQLDRQDRSSPRS